MLREPSHRAGILCPLPVSSDGLSPCPLSMLGPVRSAVCRRNATSRFPMTSFAPVPIISLSTPPQGQIHREPKAALQITPCIKVFTC